MGVYILLCANGSYYTGSTDDIERRIVQHREGKVKSTKNIRPVILKAFIEFETLSEGGLRFCVWLWSSTAM